MKYQQLSKQHFKNLIRIERKKHHPLIHQIHKKYKISKKTLFYIKEYGPKSNVSKVIIKESIKILLFSSIISSLGGFGLEKIKSLFVSIYPLIILFPALNDMIGDYGTIISSKFSAMLHEGKIKGKMLINQNLKFLFIQIFLASIITAIISSFIALTITFFLNHPLNIFLVIKIFAITIIDTIILVICLSILTISAGIYFYKKQEDPNNLLIPLTTSVADFGNMIILALLVIVFF